MLKAEKEDMGSMDERLSSKRYEPPSINLKNKNNSHTLVVELAGINNLILEVGTSTGYMTKVLRDLGNHIIGVEIDEEAAEIASKYCDLMITGDVEEVDFDEYMGPSSIDVAIFGDVLEHLKYPATVLERIKGYLKPEGYIVVSIPNFCHGDVLFNLLKGDFKYTSMGLLDETHLRFFGHKNVIDLLNDCSYLVTDILTTRIPMGYTELKIESDEMPRELFKFIESLPNSDVYQFVLRAKPTKNPKREPTPGIDLNQIFARSIEDILKEQLQPLERQIAEIEIERQAALSSIANFEGAIRERDVRMAELGEELRRTVERAESLDQAVSERDARMAELGYQLRQSENNSQRLENEIEEMRRSVIWQLLMKYHNGFVERSMPHGTKRRNLYDLGLKGFRILVNEGPISFWGKFKEYLGKKKNERSDYELWIRNNEPLGKDSKAMRRTSKYFLYRPKISILTPVWNTEERWLRAAIDSVLAQTFDNWELCIVDGGSEKSHVAQILKEYSARDARIKIKLIGVNKGIAGNTNDALSMATGEFVALMDHDDTLAPFALYEIANLLNERPRLKFIYSDEDKMDGRDQRFEPFFKPDWSPDLLLSCGYTNHLGVYRTDVLREIGGFRERFEGSQDYDMLLRFSEAIDESEIGHIPKILYHWRQIPGSTAVDPYAKNGLVVSAAKSALKDALERRNIKAEVIDGLWPSSYRIKREILGEPLVSIIIPTKDNLPFLEKCINGIKDKTTYENYELIVVDNNSEETNTLTYLEDLDAMVLKYEDEFNFSSINNFAAEYANGDCLIFLNNDTLMITPDWIQAMLEHAQRPEVGAVGCKLLYPDGSIQHAGVVLGLSPDEETGVAGHVYNKFCYEDPGYFGMINTIRNYSAVTAAAMMIRKSVFEEIGGFDEDLAVCYNDVDLCLKLRERGYLIVYTPYAELYHYESVSRGCNIDIQEAKYMLNKWGAVIKSDPYYSPNLSLRTYDCRMNIYV